MEGPSACPGVPASALSARAARPSFKLARRYVIALPTLATRGPQARGAWCIAKSCCSPVLVAPPPVQCAL